MNKYECERCHAEYIIPVNVEMPEGEVCMYCDGNLVEKG
jgi:DNA-directed RNA polymerase subunit RPC12/RpoP